MAKGAVNIVLNLDGHQSFQQISQDADKLRQILQGTIGVGGELQRTLNFAALSQAANNAMSALGSLQGSLKGLVAEWEVNEVNSKRMEVAMRNTFDATDDDIAKINALCDAQQRLGVIAAGTQKAGVQELATYVDCADALEAMIPIMNDMAVQQYGLGVSAESVASIATMLGKVYNGQTSALSRLGYSFDENQERLIKYGTAQQKYATICEVVGANVAGMNAEIAKTDNGKLQQLKNDIDDQKSAAGELAAVVMPYVDWAVGAGNAAFAMTQLVTASIALAGSLKSTVVWIGSAIKGLWTKTSAVIANTKAVIANSIAMGQCGVASKLFVIGCRAAYVALMGLGIGLIIAAIWGLIEGLKYAYNHCESFRNACDRLWQVIKPLVVWVGQKLAQAFEWLSKKIAEAWNWICEILGLDGKKIEIEANVKYKESYAPFKTKEDRDAVWAEQAKKREAAAKGKGKGTKNTSAQKEATYRENASTLEEIEENVPS